MPIYKILASQKQVLSLEGPPRIEQEFTIVEADSIEEAERETGGIVILMARA